MPTRARIALAAGAAALALAPAAASAATYAVTDTADTPVGQDCGGTTGCSLREAITSANATPGVDDTIEVAAGDYTLTEGELTVTDALTVAGTGEEWETRIDAAGASRVVAARGAGTALTLHALGITGGHVSEPVAQGAGVYAEGPLTLTSVALIGNVADGAVLASGGGIFQTDPSAPVAITDSLLADNAAVSGASATGGGLSVAGPTTITGSELYDNDATGDVALGGGAHAGGPLTVIDSRLVANSAGFLTATNARGGGIAAAGPTLVVRGSTIENGSAIGATAAGGGILRLPSGGGSDSASVTTSLVASNDVEGTIVTGGGVAVEGTTLEIRRSTFHDNRAIASGLSGTATGAGAAALPGGALEITNATLHFNRAWALATGSDAYGAGLYAAASGSTITASTITANAVIDGGGDQVAGGGVAGWGASTTIVVAGSILSGNVQPAADADCTTATLASLGGNVVNQADGASGCTYAGGSDDVVTAAPGLGPLGDHGGPTETMLPDPGSPALDRYDGPECPAADQRDVSRPQGAACDAGAVERRPGTLAADPAALDFGDQALGAASAARTVVLVNVGDAEATGIALSLAGPDAGDFAIVADTCPAALPAGASCSADVTFTPGAPGARTARLDGPATPVALAGTGLAPPAPAGEDASRCADLDVTTSFEAPVDVTLRCSPTVWSWDVVDGPRHGELSAIDPQGGVRYTPAPGFAGEDAFSYRALGPAGASPPAVVRIAVAPGSAPPPSPAPPAPPIAPASPVCDAVPDLAGRTLAAVRRALRRAGCADVPLDVTRRGRGTPRRVVRQTPAAGAALHADERIAVVLRPRARR